ncbi:MAG: hypothetical protein B7733_03575 [Myxococcales bacterium FL481]|nr:MAG: hypothetical protein B7733_03575 [Myxococcales bacterium FL481]
MPRPRSFTCRLVSSIALGLGGALVSVPALAQECLDPSRDILVEAPRACRSLAGDPDRCNRAWAVNIEGDAVSCFVSGSSCRGCGPSRVGIECENACAAAPAPAPALGPGAVAALLILCLAGGAVVGTRRGPSALA